MSTETHEVFNQAPQMQNFDTVQHPIYDEFIAAIGAGAAAQEIHDFGRAAGSEHVQHLGELAEQHPPVLKTHDRFGHRVDRVEYQPAYHELMNLAIEGGLGGAPWQEERDHAHLIRAAKFTAWQASDVGHTCPITMTYAAVPALRADSELANRYAPPLSNKKYDPSFSPPELKTGLTAGMSMTEKQGGSDVRANTTRAFEQGDGTYLITGHKWFTSAPMSDILLTLAQTPDGLTCFVVPRVLPDGTTNQISLMRLKDKLGNRSNASAEIEYSEATGWRLGDEGRGVPTIVEMVNMTRLDVTLTSAALMMNGLTRAVHHARHREAFGDLLIDKPLMRNVIADLAIEAEASSLSGLWLASLTDKVHQGDSDALALRRLALAALKYYVTKRAPGHTAESLECLGGNGYIEESGMPRIYREAPLGSIWEGSGNVAALDVLRVLGKQPRALDATYEFLDQSTGADIRYDKFIAQLKRSLSTGADLEFNARSLVGDLAIALQAALLTSYGNSATAEMFLATRLNGSGSSVYGTLPTSDGVSEIVTRAISAVN